MQRAGKKEEKGAAKSTLGTEMTRFRSKSLAFPMAERQCQSRLCKTLSSVNLMNLPLQSGVENKIIDELSKEFEHSVIERALADCPRFLFTTPARGKAIVKYHEAGLLPSTILKDVIQCQEEDVLDKLLELSLMIQNKGRNPQDVHHELRLRLIKKYSIKDALENIIKIPFFMLSNIEIGDALIACLIEGSNENDVYSAYYFDHGNVNSFRNVLQTLKKISGIRGVRKLNQYQLNSILIERYYLTSESLWTNAVSLVATEPNQASAMNALRLHRDFGYIRKFREISEQRSRMARTELENRRSMEVGEKAEGNRREAKLKKEPEVNKELSRNERKLLEMDRPQLFAEKWDAAKAKFDTKIEAKSRGEIDAIDRQEAESKKIITNIEGPNEEGRFFGQYKEYFANVGFHPDALIALEKSGEDLSLATSIMLIIFKVPVARDLLLKVLTMQQIKKIFSIEPNPLLKILQYGVDQTAIYEIANEEDNVLIVNDSIEIGLKVERINAIAHNLIELKKYVVIRNIKDLDLFKKYEPVDIIRLAKAFKNPPEQQIDFLLKIFGKSDNTESMLYVLNLCKIFGWNSEDIVDCLAQAGPNSSEGALKEIVCSRHLARYNKDSQFRAWLRAVGQLVDIHYATIFEVRGWSKLPGATPITWEAIYAVRPYDMQFVIHYHPGVKKASVAAPNASDSHFKPYGNAKGIENRMDFVEAPQSIQKLIQKNT